MLHEEESERELTLYKVLSVSMPTHHRVSRSYKAVVLSPLASVQHSLEEGEGRERGRRDGERREGRRRRDGEREEGRWENEKEKEREAKEKRGEEKGEGRVGMRREGGEGEESSSHPGCTGTGGRGRRYPPRVS